MQRLAVQVVRSGTLRVELRWVRLEPVHPHRAAHGTTDERDVIVIEVVDVEGRVGWGECSALAHPTYTSEYLGGCWQLLVDELIPTLLESRPDEVALGLQRVAGHPMAKAGLVTALLDLDLRSRGTSLASALGDGDSGRPMVECTAVIGLQDDVDSVIARVAEAVGAGFTSVKLKIAPGNDVAPVHAVRRIWPDLTLAVDANGSYPDTDSAAERLVGHLDVAGLGLAYVEQPLPADDLVGTAVLARRLGVPIALDESVESLGDACTALALGAMSMVNVKPARVGGPIAAVAIAQVVSEQGAGVFCGGMLESGIGRASALAFAAQPFCTGPTDLGPSSSYFLRDLTEPFELVNGSLTVPSGPGIGVVPDAAMLESATIKQWRS